MINCNKSLFSGLGPTFAPFIVANKILETTIGILSIPFQKIYFPFDGKL